MTWTVADEFRELARIYFKRDIPIAARVNLIIEALTDRDIERLHNSDISTEGLSPDQVVNRLPTESYSRVPVDELGLPRHRDTEQAAAAAEFRAWTEDPEAAIDRYCKRIRRRR